MHSLLLFLWILSALKGADSLLHSEEGIKEPLLSSSLSYSSSSTLLKHDFAPGAALTEDHVPVDISKLHGDSEFGFWAMPIVRKDFSTNNLSKKKPKPRLSRIWEIVATPVNYIATVQNDRGFRAYQDLAAEVALKTESQALKAFAGNLRGVGPHFQKGLTLLQTDNLSFRERVWILGLLAYLEPQDSKVKDVEPGKDLWIGRGELELARTRGRIRTSQVRNLWSGSEEDSEENPFDPAVKETLQRIEILHVVYKSFRLHNIDSTTPAFRQMHDYLLKKKLPSEENDKIAYNYNVKTLVMDENAHEREKIAAYILNNHLVDYRIDTGLTQMARMNRDFRQSFHKVMAQRTCKKVIEDKALTSRVRHLLAPLKDLQSLTSESEGILPAIKAITSGGLEVEERVQLYQFVNAASTFIDPIAQLWGKEIESHVILPLPLALVWEKLYPTLEPDGARLLNYEYLIFIAHSGLLASARRTLLAQRIRIRIYTVREQTPESARVTLNAAQQQVLKDVFRLDSLPRRVQVEESRGWRESDQLAFNLQRQLIYYHSQRGNPSTYDPQVHMLCFEIMNQLTAYHYGFEEWLVEKMRFSDDLREAISYLSKKVISHERVTSGIAPQQLQRFATIMERHARMRDYAPPMKALIYM